MKVRMIALVLISCFGSLFESTAQEGFVSLDTILDQAILEPMYYSAENFVGDTIDGYHAAKILLTTEAASALSHVEARLNKQGLGLKVLDGYRPQIAVDHFLRWSIVAADTAQKGQFYPNTPKHLLFEKGYIAKQSGHSRGSAIDLTLVDLLTGKELDMGTTVDYFGSLSHTDSREITVDQCKNRRILRNVMQKEGFAAIETEWWHFYLKNEPFPDTYFTFPIR